MAEVHGKNTVIKVGAADISTYTDNSTFPRTADIHDLTTYGKNSHVKKGGLRNGTFQMGGVFDDGATGTPKELFEGNEGTTFSLTRQLKGTGSGLPQQAFDAVLSNYTDTAPVADYIRWTAEFEVSDDVDYTDQT